MTSYVSVSETNGLYFFRSAAELIDGLVYQSVFDGHDWTIYVYGFVVGYDTIDGREVVLADWPEGSPEDRASLARSVAQAASLPEEVVRFVVK